MKNKKFCLNIVVLVLLFFFAFLVLGSEDSGCKYFKNYSNYDYNHQPQNWGITQDSDGIIYVANQGGVLVYDGTSWELISTPEYTLHARSLDIDDSGVVYIGGENEMGYLAHRRENSLEYVSLLDFVQDEYKNFAIAFRTHATKEGIFFRTSKYLFRWNGRQIDVLCDAKRKLKSSFICQGNLYVQDEKNGLSLFISNTFKPLPGSEGLAADIIYMMVPYPSAGNTQTFLIGTRERGFFLYDGTKAIPFPVEVNAELNNSRQSYGIRLHSGDFAVATLNGGLFIMDSQGCLKYNFNKSTGLQDNNVKFVFEDKHGNIWLALNKGISRLEYASPFFFYDDRADLPGMVISVVRNHGDLYAGTTQGLYFLPPGQKAFLPIPGISDNCWSILSLENSLLAATTEGIFQVDQKSKAARNVLNCKAYSLLPSQRFPHRTWCGTDSGLVVLTGSVNPLRDIKSIDTISQPIRYLAEDETSLWLVTLSGEVLKADFPGNNWQPVVSVLDKSGGLPEGEIYITNIAGHLVFATIKGLYRLDKGNKKFIPDFTLGEKFAGGPTAKAVFRLVEDRDKHIWFQSESRLYIALPQRGGAPIIQSQRFLRLPTVQVNEIYPDPDSANTWFAGNDGLIRFDKTVKKDYRQDFKTLIRKVTANGKTISDSFINKNNKPGEPPLPVLEYRDRNLQFEYAAPFFEPENETTYRCILEGYDKHWSSWNKDYKKLYTNLDSGRYTFRVQAKNIYEHPGSTANFQFKILPPWYKTWWAFLIYMAAGSGAIFLLLLWRAGKLQEEKYKLELIVKERTKEINEKNLQLESQTRQLKEQSEQLKEMDIVKSRFFANISHEFRTPLTLIMSPLEQILSENPSESQQERINLALQNSQRLLTLINQLLELSRFDSGKMKLQASGNDIVAFLKFIVQSFQTLALRNRLEVELVSAAETILLYFDGQKMEEVMYNVLINAVKFTLPGGKITVEAAYDSSQGSGLPGPSPAAPDYVKITVKDTGVGIPREQLPHVFDRFFQANAPKEMALKGTGIGLALTKEIINLHQGKIDIHSQEGKGTEVVIRLPLGHTHLAPEEILSTIDTTGAFYKPKGLDDRHISIDREAPDGEEDIPAGEGSTNKAAHDTGSPGTEKTVVLVVEDHEDVRRHIRDSLIPSYSVVEAKDGKSGIAKAREIIPDLVVSDIMMPGVDGFELCKTLKKDIDTSHIPIILLTAKASEESIIRGLETGADDYVTKPFNTRMLLTRIKNLIELRRQLQLKIQRQKMLLPAEISVSSMDEKFLKELQEMIEKNLEEPEFDVDRLCGKLYMGRSTLYRKVQALTGETPNQFIQSYRLERAAQLLRENYGNVTEVAMAVGFSSSTYFATCFKEKFHQSPSAFRASESKSR